MNSLVLLFFDVLKFPVIFSSFPLRLRILIRKWKNNLYKASTIMNFLLENTLPETSTRFRLPEKVKKKCNILKPIPNVANFYK